MQAKKKIQKKNKKQKKSKKKTIQILKFPLNSASPCLTNKKKTKKINKSQLISPISQFKNNHYPLLLF